MKKALRIILTILSILLVFAPSVLLMAHAGVCLAMGAATIANISIFSAACVIFGILNIIGIATKQVYKTTPWILALSAYIICPNLLSLSIVALGLLLDDIIIEPLMPEE